MSCVWRGRIFRSVRFRFESYLPAAHTKKEAQYIRLLLLLNFFDVFKGTHLLKETKMLAKGFFFVLKIICVMEGSESFMAPQDAPLEVLQP